MENTTLELLTAGFIVGFVGTGILLFAIVQASGGF